MHRIRTITRVVAVLGGAALATSLAVAPASAHATTHHPVAPATVSVQTYNMDGGGDLTPLFDSSLSLVAATSIVWRDMVAGDITTRAKGMARNLARTRPDVVGLQEVAVWSAAPFDLATQRPTGPFAVQYDSLATLLAELARLGTPYRVASTVKTFGNEAFPLPAITGVDSTGAPLASLVTFTDSNVVLVRESALAHGMRLSNAQSHLYQAALELSLNGQTVYSTRGWAQVDIRVHGRSFRFVDTHLEAWGVPDTLKDQVRNPQAMELAAVLAASPIPVVLVGDINARPDMCTNTPRTTEAEHALDQNVKAYTILRTSGLTEAWYAVHPRNACSPRSWTSGSRILDDPANLLTHRIDDVFTSAGARTVAVTVVGNRPSAMSGGLWPSDHASTWAIVRIF
jgi:endonuclease/exonuclease/phosphatase family metal-dependent hydrolase